MHGTELWKSDGTSAGTVLVQDISEGAAGSEPTQITLVGNRLFVDTTTGTVGRELWVADLTPTNPADYDRNGLVEQADYEFWRDHFGESAGVGLQADGNNDGTVDAADYTAWRDAFATPPAAVSSAAGSAITVSPSPIQRSRNWHCFQPPMPLTLTPLW